MKKTPFDVDYSFFSGARDESVAILKFKERPIMYAADLHEKELFFDYLDNILTHEKIKVILFIFPSKKMGNSEYSAFYRKLSNRKIPSWSMDTELIVRFYNAINQFVLKIAGCDKIVISADNGEAPLLYLSVSLAYDYRLIAENTLYSNPNLKLGVVPKGGLIYFLLKVLGRKKTFDILLSENDIDAAQALELGLVDRVVPANSLERVAIEVAKTYAEIPFSYLSGIKRLINYDTKILRDVLEYENEILQKGSQQIAESL